MHVNFSDCIALLTTLHRRILGRFVLGSYASIRRLFLVTLEIQHAAHAKQQSPRYHCPSKAQAQMSGGVQSLSLIGVHI